MTNNNQPIAGPEITKKAKRIAIFSDIHANFHAFEAVLAAIEKENADLLICCGDIVGYGADPSACIQRLKDLRAIVVTTKKKKFRLGQSEKKKI